MTAPIEHLNLYYVNLPWACGGIEVGMDNIIKQTAPIFKRWRGERLFVFIIWVCSHKGDVEVVL